VTTTRTSIVCIGGGHGLSVTLRACRPWAGDLTAIVSVADDGGSSGRLRAEHPLLPAPGDIRRCLTTLADPARTTMAAALERRIAGGDDDIAGHAVGNLVLLALADELGDFDAAVAALAETLGVTAQVLPASTEAVELIGNGTVRGQVAVEADPSVHTVRLDPPDPDVPKAAIEAIDAADLVVLGPGSFYGSVLAAVVAPKITAALQASSARTVLVHNLRTDGPDPDHVAVLRRHGIEPDIVIEPDADIARPHGLAHDPAKLGRAISALAAGPPQPFGRVARPR
jgi:uncharacterized cofD-like protein